MKGFTDQELALLNLLLKQLKVELVEIDLQ